MRLLCTFGGTWAVVPEVLAFLDPERVPLYANHPGRERFRELRVEYGIEPAADVWIVTTDQRDTISPGLAKLHEWWELRGRPFAIRIWRARGTGQLATESEVFAMRELTFRAALAASDSSPAALSLAGGRKTMSADMQTAGQVFGARALLHVLGPERDFPERLRGMAAKDLDGELPAGDAAVLMPVIVGRGQRSDLLDVLDDQDQRITSETFLLPDAASIEDFQGGWWPDKGAFVAPERRFSLVQAIETRQRDGGRLPSNFLASVTGDEPYENWPSLYRLPPRVIETLHKTAVEPIHEALLKDLPKADLHRHLGGALTLEAQVRVGREVWSSLTGPEREGALEHSRSLREAREWPADWPAVLKEGDRTANTAAVLSHVELSVLEANLFPASVVRRRLLGPAFDRHYALPGELMGSALLGRECAVAPYAREALRQAEAEGLAYVELRGSPFNYLKDEHAVWGPKERALRFVELLGRAVSSQPSTCKARFIVIADRRGRGPAIREIVRFALEARETDALIAGVDLAGNEEESNPKRFREDFEGAFEHCLPLTIHAGEGQKAEHIWEAAYHLHADRIGHGLTLVNRPDLAERFRNRKIAIEMCPTSNVEVVGYRETVADEDRPVYPLRTLLDQGQPLTLCTDNPGICRTTLAHEYVVAAQLASAGGKSLSLWEALLISRQAFVHAFLPATERQRLMREVDRAVLEHIEAWPGLR